MLPKHLVVKDFREVRVIKPLAAGRQLPWGHRYLACSVRSKTLSSEAKGVEAICTVRN